MLYTSLFRAFCLTLPLIISFSMSLYAVETQVFRESVRARGMGSAFTAAANDEMVLYYNPANLRSVRHNSFELLGGSLAVNDRTLRIAEDLKGNDSSSTEYQLSRLTGEKLFLEGNLSGLSLVTQRFGFGFSGKTLLDVQLRNPVVPYLDVKAYVQMGGIGGIAWSFWDYELDIGIALKGIHRQGIDRKFRLFDPVLIEAANENDTTKLEKEFSKETRFAPDLGITYHLDEIHNLATKLSLTVQQIGGMDFENAGYLPMQINLGASTSSELKGIDVVMAVDYHDLLNAQDLNPDGQFYSFRHLKLGAEAGFLQLFNGHPLFAFRFGWEGSYMAYGASLNLYGLKLDYAQWGEEIGDYAGDKEDRRTMLQASLIF